MWELMIAAVGVLGGILLGQHSAWLQRRNWQRQEAMKAYADLFTVGDEALRICTTIAMWQDNLDSQLGESSLAEAARSDPAVQKEDDKIQSMRRDFSRSEDQRFRHLLTQCWMLERKPETRNQLKEFEKQYQSCKVGLALRRSKLVDRRKQAMEESISRKPSPDTLFQVLEKLQIIVAKQYFHGGDADVPSGDQGG
jgi:hypothetical protein